MTGPRSHGDRDAPPTGWDRVPRLYLRYRRHLFGAWEAMGRIGALAGALSFAALTVLRGAPAWEIVAVVAANLASVEAWGLLSKLWRRRRRYVLLEHALVAWLATVAVTVAVDGELTVIADAWVVGMSVTLACGRAGCLFTGCCHGRVARRGVRYPWLRPWTLGPPWSELRVVPLQVVELGAFVVLGVAGAALTLRAPGWAASVIPVCYAVLRYELELWRGDPRPHLARWSEAQLLCVVVLALVIMCGVAACGLAGGGALAFITLGQWRRFGPAPPLADAPTSGAAADRGSPLAIDDPLHRSMRDRA